MSHNILFLVACGPPPQVINDYYDREIDAINEPYRPIPSGKITEIEAVIQFSVLLAAGLATAYALDTWHVLDASTVRVTHSDASAAAA